MTDPLPPQKIRRNFLSRQLAYPTGGAPKPTHLWVDLETTGLGVEDVILEVACILTGPGPDYSKIWEFSSLVYPSRLPSVDLYVCAMHAKNGLWEDLQEITGRANYRPEVTDQRIREKLEFYGCKPDRKLILSGSSVHFDRSFLERSTFTFLDFCSHRHLDTTSIRMFMESAGYASPPNSETVAHRALEDINYSLGAVQYYAKTLKDGW